jgi:hypothetical protein
MYTGNIFGSTRTFDANTPRVSPLDEGTTLGTHGMKITYVVRVE